MANFHILLIEDNAADVELWHEAFKEAQLSYRMTVLSDGNEAEAYVHNKQRESDTINLILLDINLPGVDGLSLLTSIKDAEWLARVPVMVTTSSSSPSERERVHAFTGTRIVIKPSNLDSFLALGTMVRQMLEQSPSHV